MKRLELTANGNFNVEVPMGRRFGLSCTGDFESATVTAQYNSGAAALKASGTLTGTTIANGDTVVIEDNTYTFVTALSVGPAVPYEVLVGVSDSVSLDNLIAAINGSAGAGTTYATGTIAHAYVDAFAGAGDTMVVKAKSGGAYGNNIDTTATLTAGDWGAAALAGGEDAADRFVPFSTTAIALTAAGEKSGTNFGAHAEINLAVTGATALTNIIAVVSLLED